MESILAGFPADEKYAGEECCPMMLRSVRYDAAHVLPRAFCAKIDRGNEEMKRYILKEYGAWGVMLMAFAAGLVAGHGVGLRALAALAALALLINAKQAFVLWIRSAAGSEKAPRAVFFAQVIVATALLTGVSGDKLMQVLPYAAVPISYLLFLKLFGEHALITETAGFVLLSLSSLVGRFAVTGEIDSRLFLAVGVFFTAGVFKVRIQLRRTMRYRVMTAAYLIAASVLYIAAGLPLLLLVPLADNIVFAATLYRAGLRTTGWVEVSKGVAFLVLLAFSYA